MHLSKKLLTLAAPAALLALNACATGLPTQVSRFQALPPPAGQTYFIVPADARDGGIEFNQYAGLVSSHLAAQGFRPAAGPNSADYLVTLEYGVDQGRTEVRTSPGFGYSGLGYGGLGYRPYFSRFGYFGRGYHPFYYGWHDPFWSPLDYPEVRSYTVYTSFLDMDIKRRADGQSLFEGSAKARSRTDNLQSLVPNLVQAMFTGFPGNSGETVRITVPPPGRGRS
jgi:Domain of unknown function (DUF4136)